MDIKTSKADLASWPGHEPPPGAHVRYIETPDGHPIRVADWPSMATEERGTMMILQGRNEAIEKYFKTIARLQRRGFNVVAFDWRRHHHTEASQHAPLQAKPLRAGDYLADINVVVSNVATPRFRPPLSLLGHSFGGTLALSALVQPKSPFVQATAIAPFLGLNTYSLSTVRAFTSLMVTLGLGSRLVPEPVKDPIAALGREKPKKQTVMLDGPEAVFKDPAVSHAPTFAWVNAASHLAGNLMKRGVAQRIEVPILLVEAGLDRTVSNAAIQQFAKKANQAELVEISGAGHDVLMDSAENVDRFWKAFDRFTLLDKHGDPQPKLGAAFG